VKLNYDPATDALYIHLTDDVAVDSDEVSDGVVLDYDAQGHLVGIDVQHARQRANIDRLVVEHVPAPGQDAA